MVWTDITRPQYERKYGRYASDCSDKEWRLIEPFLPPRKHIGRPRTTQLRDVWDAIQYMAATGCQWAMIPNDFPPLTFRTATGLFMYSSQSVTHIPGCAMFLPMAVMQDQSCAANLRKSAAGQWKLSNVLTPQKALKSSREDGWWNAPSHGSADAADWQRTGRNQSYQQKAGY